MVARPKRRVSIDVALDVDERPLSRMSADDAERAGSSDETQLESGETAVCCESRWRCGAFQSDGNESCCAGECKTVGGDRTSALSDPKSADGDCDDETLLVFTRGSETYTPHQIGVKRVLTKDLENSDRKSTEGRDDEVDHVIELSGHIIGMSLSPDHR